MAEDFERRVCDVGRRVSELRRNAGHTQEQFAALLGVSARWVRRLEQQGENPVSYTHLTLPTIYSV